MILLCFVICVLAFYFSIDKIGINNKLLKIALSSFVSLSILSLSFTVFLFAGIHFMVFQLLFFFGPLFIIVIKWRKQKSENDLFKAIKQFPFQVIIPILLGLLLFSYRFFTTVLRWGDWDAWAIWSQHAKFLTYSDYFANLFTNKIAWTHPDYPLMLPSIIAIIWKSFDNFSAIVPAFLAYFIALLLIVVIMSSFFEKKFWLSGVFITLLLSATSILFPFALSQFSDTLLACFILLPFIVLNHLPKTQSFTSYLLIGFLAATCVWIKNEGLMFFAIFSFCLLIKYYKQRKMIGGYVLGALFPIFVFGIFKIFFSTPSDLLSAKTSYWEKVSDVSRYQFIFDFATDYFVQNCIFLLALLALMVIINRRFFISFPFIVIALLFLSYLCAYVISPYGLQWHMSTSFERLVHQIVPTLLYAIFFTTAQKFKKKQEDKISTNGAPIF